MSLLSDLGGILQRYSGGGGGTGSAPADPHQDFHQVANAAPQSAVAEGLADAFRSDRTPPFPEMLASLFQHSDASQRTGILNRLLGALGQPQTTPEQAQQVAPDSVRQMAAQAEQQDPSIIEQASHFYAQHPDTVKALGAVALTVLLGRMARR
jgi:hypothetical protein